MRVKIITGLSKSYACIQTTTTDLDIPLAAGKSSITSLRETANQWFEQAQELEIKANLVWAAAEKLEEDLKSGRKFS
jgi:alcohol dehydrogenase YqhD (iron-dependent ADH family)